MITAIIGADLPVTGPAAGWGYPAAYGAEIWIEDINEAGGIQLADGTSVMLKQVIYDNEYIGDKALTGAKKLILEDNAVVIQMLGGHTAFAAVPFMTQQEVMSFTFLATDCNPETPYHLAPAETGPIFYQTTWEFAKETWPDKTKMALLSQEDEYGKNCFAIYEAWVEVNPDYEFVYKKFFDMETTDFAPIVSAVLETEPDIVSTSGAWPDFQTLIMEQLYLQGWDGPIITGVLDNYADIIDRTSVEFVEDTLFSFPDYDDPAMGPAAKAFYDEYISRYPGQWTAVSHEEMAGLVVWKAGVEKAGSIEPLKVNAALKSMTDLPHMFGPANWYGKGYFGVDNALIGKWPVIAMKDGEARIQKFVENLEWWENDVNRLTAVEKYEEYGLMWWQVMGLPKEAALQQYGLEEYY